MPLKKDGWRFTWNTLAKTEGARFYKLTLKKSPEKIFGNQIDRDAFSQICADRNARILDYGCGYGRLCSELWNRGYKKLTGIDNSPGMIRRAKKQFPSLEF